MENIEILKKDNSNSIKLRIIIFCHNIETPPSITKYLPQFETQFVANKISIYEYILMNYDDTILPDYLFFIGEHDMTLEIRKKLLELIENKSTFFEFSANCLFTAKSVILKKQKKDYCDLIEANKVFFLQPDTTKTLPQNIAIPNLVFIVPYRDREEQLKFYLKHTKNELMLGRKDYEILIIHQNDQRSFNRGALKNIGFLFLRQKYPNDYQRMTIVFNDVDIMPINQNFIHYETTQGIVKHFYGFSNTLGGIFSITGADFEKTGGFPNFWTWGYEDNAIQNRVQKNGIFIDRSRFYPIFDKNFILLHDGRDRQINVQEVARYAKLTNEGFNDIQYIVWNDVDYET
ncbi:MAG: hypothetical protein EBU01_15710, partial [Crocinitomicaceae bacterium]|nr:hypothetical protein [Crocinitomicaceae bacterium]